METDQITCFGLGLKGFITDLLSPIQLIILIVLSNHKRCLQ